MNKLFGAWLCLTLAACTGAEPPAQTPEDPETPEALEIETGECEGSPLQRAADTGVAEPSVWAEVDAQSRIVVHLDDMTANCCPSPEATLTGTGSALALDFLSVSATESCDCVCIFDFQVTSGPQSPGSYTIDVVFDGESFGTLEVIVP
jgi:hypothetical protein